MASVKFILQRVVEVSVAALAAAVALLTLWAGYATIVDRNEVETSFAILLSIVYVLTFLSLALLLFAARLAVPKLRLTGGRVVGPGGLGAAFFLYALMLVVALLQGRPEAQVMVLAILLGVGLAITWPFKRGRGREHQDP